MRLILDVEKCTGCKICELICSAKHQGIFNPKKAHLKIIDNYTKRGSEAGVCPPMLDEKPREPTAGEH